MKIKRSRIGVMALVVMLFSCDTGGSVDPLFKEYFIRYYGEDGNQEARDILVNSDGTMVLLGYTQTALQVKRIFLAKVDPDGNVLWQRKFGSNSENPRDIEFIPAGQYAGNYVVLTNTQKPVGDSTLVKLVIVDQNGNAQDSVEYDVWQSQFGYSVTTTLDGGFIVTGNTSPEAFNDGVMAVTDLSDLLSIRFDDNLVLSATWPTNFGGEGDVMGIRYFEVSPSEHYFAAYTDKLLPGEPDVIASYEYNYWFNKVVTIANVTNRTQFFDGGSNSERMTWIANSPSGTHLAIGTTTNSSGSPAVFLSKLINDFSLVETSRSYSTGFEGVSACASGINRFLIVGNRVRTNGLRDIWLARVNPALDLEFEEVFGGASNDDRAAAVAELPNGDILVLGTMYLTNQDKLALIKLKPNGHFE